MKLICLVLGFEQVAASFSLPHQSKMISPGNMLKFADVFRAETANLKSFKTPTIYYIEGESAIHDKHIYSVTLNDEFLPFWKYVVTNTYMHLHVEETQNCFYYWSETPRAGIQRIRLALNLSSISTSVSQIYGTYSTPFWHGVGSWKVNKLYQISTHKRLNV